MVFKNKLRLFRQAIANPETKEIIDYETLARILKQNWEFSHLWNFFKLIEDLWLKKEFDYCFLDKSIERISEKEDESVYHINVYPKTLFSSWFEAFLQQTCKRYNFLPSRVIIEIIESGEPLKIVIERLKVKVMQLLNTEAERMSLRGWFRKDSPEESVSPLIVDRLNERILSLKQKDFAIFIDDYPSWNNTKDLVTKLKNTKGVKIDWSLIKHL